MTFLIKAQRLQYIEGLRVNDNFLFEFRRDENEIWTEFILKIQSDSVVDNHIIILSGARDIRNFIMYLECHIKPCFKDEQPLFLPGMAKLIYNSAKRSYIDENGNLWFERKSFLYLLKELNKLSKKMDVQNISYKRMKYIF